MIVALVFVYSLAAANWTVFYLDHKPQQQTEAWHPPMVPQEQK